ncbi:MAG: glycosyltransferase family 2 protein [Anaerolineae bacterium]|uniref:glycosyltransferase family 2 protein n=1 Tax=Thermogutta sp. TaxID=1962930 RepID=UPI00321FA092
MWGALIALFWLSALAVAWTHVGYPLFIILLARWRPRPHQKGEVLPTVSLIIPAYNEEAVIGEKLENALTLDYPRGRIEIIVVADGSTDRTVEIVEGFADWGVRLLFQPERRGKIAAMNRAVPYAQGKILVFSDANAMMEPESLRALVRNFADPRVACVSGEKRVRADQPVQAQGESAYWRYESSIKRAESVVNTAIGAVGEFFAIRRELYRPLREDSIIEDFVLSMQLVMEGWRVVYEPEAVAWEEASPTLKAEWERRARNCAGGFQAVGRLIRLFSPRYSMVAFQFLSHKILRWLSPFFMLLAWLTALVLYPFDLYRLLFWGQTAFYLLALVGGLLSVKGWRWRPLWLIFYFCFANATALSGFWRYVTGRQNVAWKKVR